MMQMCPECDGVMSWNSYFQAFICLKCGYDSRDDPVMIPRTIQTEENNKTKWRNKHESNQQRKNN